MQFVIAEENQFAEAIAGNFNPKNHKLFFTTCKDTAFGMNNQNEQLIIIVPFVLFL